MDLSAYDTPPRRTSTGEQDRSAYTAEVTRVDESGVWAVPLGDDKLHPIGPCRGTAAVGDLVLLVLTQEHPWVVGGTA